MTLMSQVIAIRDAENLQHTGVDDEGHSHAHKALGVYDELEQVIYLDRDLHHERAREVMVHEALHAMLAVTSLARIINAEAPEMDEHLVTVLAPAVLSWLRDNPGLIDWLEEVPE